MTNPNVHDSNKPILESEKPRLVYQPPTLTRLEEYDIESGSTNVPENNNGLLESQRDAARFQEAYLGECQSFLSCRT